MGLTGRLLEMSLRSESDIWMLLAVMPVVVPTCPIAFSWWMFVPLWIALCAAVFAFLKWDDREEMVRDLKEWWNNSLEAVAEWTADRLDDVGSWALERSQDIQGWLKTRP
jgi:hypothetical protein